MVEPLLPPPPRPPYGWPVPHHLRPGLVRRDRLRGPHVDPMAAAAHRELGCGSPVTCWHRLTEWATAGVFDQLHLKVLDRLGELGQLDWSRTSVDSASMRAKRGGPCGCKSSRSWQAWKQVPPGLRRQWPAANRGGDRRQHRRHHRVPGGPERRAADPHAAGQLGASPARSTPTRATTAMPTVPAWRRRGIMAWIARRGMESSTRLGRHRWRVERSLSWLSCWRRLQVRVGSGFRALVGVCAAGLCVGVLQPALAGQWE
jgi:hypothetical protein